MCTHLVVNPRLVAEVLPRQEPQTRAQGDTNSRTPQHNPTLPSRRQPSTGGTTVVGPRFAPFHYAYKRRERACDYNNWNEIAHDCVRSRSPACPFTQERTDEPSQGTRAPSHIYHMPPGLCHQILSSAPPPPSKAPGGWSEEMGGSHLQIARSVVAPASATTEADVWSHINARSIPTVDIIIHPPSVKLNVSFPILIPVRLMTLDLELFRNVSRINSLDLLNRHPYTGHPDNMSVCFIHVWST